MEERKIIERLQKGDTKALEKIIDAYSNYVQAVVKNIIGVSMTYEDIEEVVSDVFLALWNQADNVQNGKLKAYLSGIARNLALNKLRQMSRTVELEEDHLDISCDGELASSASLENEILQKEQGHLLKEALNEMGQPDSEIFLRHYYYYQRVEVIAVQMGMNVSTVKSRLKRGRDKLKQILLKSNYFADFEEMRSKNENKQNDEKY